MLLSVEDLTKYVDQELALALTESLQREDQQTYFMSFEGGFLLLYRYLGREEGFSYGNLRYLYIDKKAFRFNFELGKFEELKNGVLSIIEELENYLTYSDLLVKHYISEVEKLEDQLFERRESSIFMDMWFDAKKHLSRFERFFSRHIKALENFESWNDRVQAVEDLEIDDLIKSTQYALYNVNGGIARLDSIHHYFTSIKNDKLNKNLYFLTVLSGVFLPLNLVVGFFGMNTKNLLFEENPQGTMYVIYVLAGIFFLSVMGQTLLRLFDRFFLRILIGRMSIYKNVSAQLKRIEDKMDFNI